MPARPWIELRRRVLGALDANQHHLVDHFLHLMRVGDHATIDLLHSRHVLGLSPCSDCRPERLVPRPDDVAQCTRCGVWWTRQQGVGPVVISREEAAGLAREPLTLEQLTAAYAAAEQEMSSGT